MSSPSGYETEMRKHLPHLLVNHLRGSWDNRETFIKERKIGYEEITASTLAALILAGMDGPDDTTLVANDNFKSSPWHELLAEELGDSVMAGDAMKLYLLEHRSKNLLVALKMKEIFKSVDEAIGQRNTHSKEFLDAERRVQDARKDLIDLMTESFGISMPMVKASMSRFETAIVGKGSELST